MLVLPFNRVDGGRNARFHNTSLRSHALGDANTHLLSAQQITTVLEGQVPCHTSFRLSLNLPAGPLHRAHVAAVVGLKLSSPAGFGYTLLKAVSRLRNIVGRLLGNGAPPKPRDQARPTTTATKW